MAEHRDFENIDSYKHYVNHDSFAVSQGRMTSVLLCFVEFR